MLGNPMPGVRIYYSTAAAEQVRNRTYSKRRAKSLRHWTRMDKKYRKRYGFHAVPAIYRMGDVFVVHPALKSQVESMFVEHSPLSNRI